MVSKTAVVFLALLLSPAISAAPLQVGTRCPVTTDSEPLGELIFSRAWFHSSRSNAAYIASDNATGIGLEVHFIASQSGQIGGVNLAQCQRYRMLQTRLTSARLFSREQPLQLDVPEEFTLPFYDQAPLEHGRGKHLTPVDSSDKPWQGQVTRDATLSIYDTPYVSDSYGIEGRHIQVQFETCLVCQRDDQYDSLLACGRWGYQRDYMGGQTGWAEPEFQGVSCLAKPSATLDVAIENSPQIEYRYWLDWRIWGE